MRRIILPIAFLVLAAFAVARLAGHVGFDKGVDPSSNQLVPADNAGTKQATASALAATMPALSGRVVDNADMLTDGQESLLVADLAAFEERSSDQVVVATILSLQGENLEDYANRLFRHWELGQKDINNGVLLLVSKADRKIRIEVGYGLEGTLTDALAKTIIETVMVPRFREGEFGNGIIEGSSFIVKVLSGDIAELEDRRRQSEDTSSDDPEWLTGLFILVWASLFFLEVSGFHFLLPYLGKKSENAATAGWVLKSI